MPRARIRPRTAALLVAALLSLTAAVGTGLGLAFAGTRNIRGLDIYGSDRPALPTQILDRKGRLITQFFSVEKREIIRFEELPRHLIDALLTREDKHFYGHRGFRVPDILRATWTTLRGGFGGGASTITQQLAGSLFADRSEITLRRKLVELWYAIQLERWLTKDEILERYLNLVYFGEGTYGIEAAAQFYTGHSARDITVAEASMLVVQLNRPGGNSPFTYPNRARELQMNNLQQMVELGHITQEEADRSLVRYWDDFDFTRSNVSSAFYERVDRARHFSEYVRLRLEELLLGKLDLYRDGLIVHTTLDLDQQAIANAVMEQHLNRVNDLRNAQRGTRIAVAEDEYLPLVDMLSLAFDIDRMRAGNHADRVAGRQRFDDELSPALDLLSLIWDTGEIKTLTRRARAEQTLRQRRVEVQGALVSIEPSSGHILSMVGGRDLARGNQFNRAVQSKVQPGSAFKPLYYSAAISSGAITPATMLKDAPVVFRNPDGTPYIPQNYLGEWQGPVLARSALTHSMNVPSLHVLDLVGFDAAIDRASRLLGVTDPVEIEHTFPRKYPLGLGVITVTPLQMARAYATFANQGREVEPIAIRYVRDRDGSDVLEVEKDLRDRQRAAGDRLRIMDPAAAYLMIDLLTSTVRRGTLTGAAGRVGGLDFPIAGKTGTTQNWADAWTVGFTPDVVTAVWMGFDEPGESLGRSLSGGRAAGTTWADYMKRIHAGSPVRDFEQPASGLIRVAVNARSGMLPSGDEPIIHELFLTGTEPKTRDTLASAEADRREVVANNLRKAVATINVDPPLFQAPLDEPAVGAGESNQPEGNPLLD